MVRPCSGEKEREKKERLRAEGKLLTGKQKEEQRKLEARAYTRPLRTST